MVKSPANQVSADLFVKLERTQANLRSGAARSRYCLPGGNRRPECFQRAGRSKVNGFDFIVRERQALLLAVSASFFRSENGKRSS